MELNKYIDYTNLNNNGTLKDIENLCDEAIKYKFASVCVYPYDEAPRRLKIHKNQVLTAFAAFC